MKGFWTWPSDPKDQEKVVEKITQEDELMSIMTMLSKSPDGLSNAQLDRLLANNSQWRTLTHMNELIALGFVQYNVQFFGDPGKYILTELGKTIASRTKGAYGASSP
jgi:hypothetical protein